VTGYEKEFKKAKIEKAQQEENEKMKIDKLLEDQNLKDAKLVDIKKDKKSNSNNLLGNPDDFSSNFSEKLKILVKGKNETAVKIEQPKKEENFLNISSQDNPKLSQVKSDYSTKDSFSLFNEKPEPEINFKSGNKEKKKEISNNPNNSLNNMKSNVPAYNKLKDDLTNFSILDDSKYNLFDTVLNQVQNKNRGISFN
jgi:hypothetical protein